MTREEFDNIMNQLFEDVGIGKSGDIGMETDSLTYMSLITSIEDEFDIEFGDNTNFTTVQELCDYIESVSNK